MKIWDVRFQITGYMQMEVEEDNHNDAVAKAKKIAMQSISCDDNVAYNINFINGSAECIDDTDI